MVFTVWSSVWFTPGVVLGVGIYWFVCLMPIASCSVCGLWVRVHCPSLVFLLMQNSIQQCTPVYAVCICDVHSALVYSVYRLLFGVFLVVLSFALPFVLPACVGVVF